ncbi:hypothetical protein Clacol_009461 [Clathrus columnatus]|uniref:NADP-dependent oxidoreductase domain-containing protein n=1 Tax=Clathrus columnatus TaxID=1419009 RepID=A0AAV5AQV8_9AGAM|nr:hypothetical protein Clacol_009461 [Clathrus columnatus]
MPIVKDLILNTGAKMPVLGLGTWRSSPGEVSRAVEIAIKAGYRHIDTAAAYCERFRYLSDKADNEKEVGDGLQAGLKATGLAREDIFLTTKLANDTHDDPWKALQASLKDLQTDYLDLWLMHWPAPMNPGHKGANKSLDWLDTWKKMEEIYQAHPELIKAIGVSNVYGGILERLYKHATVTPAINQIEMHPGVDSSTVVTETLKHGTKITGYSPLGSEGSKLHDNPLVIELAEKYSVTPANILISLQANKPGVSVAERWYSVVLAKSVTESRIISNMKLVELTEEEVAKLDGLHTNHSFRIERSGHGEFRLGFLLEPITDGVARVLSPKEKQASPTTTTFNHNFSTILNAPRMISIPLPVVEDFIPLQQQQQQQHPHFPYLPTPPPTPPSMFMQFVGS